MSKKTGTAKGGNTRKPGGNVPRPNVEKEIPSFIDGGIVTGPIEKLGKDPLAEPVVEGKLPINIARWEEAQKAEREQHTMDAIEGAIHYGKAYKNYFKYLSRGNNLHGLNIIEVGSADFPALAACANWGAAIIVEPMPSEILLNTCKEYGFGLYQAPFEGLEFEELPGITEIWLFNVMQHIIDPEVFIQKAKKVADRIRFFEPIDQPVTSYHPHTYGLKDYQRWFGDCVNLYAGGSVEGFHQADCVYGVWVKEQ